jgi:hypothetical protein
MPVFGKEWFAVPPGQIYPVTYGVGDECPPELAGEAQTLGLLAADGATEKGAEPTSAKHRKARG